MIESEKERVYIKTDTVLSSIINGNDALISSLSNFVAVLKSHFDFFWVGFYLVENEKLILGPFQGPLASQKLNSVKVFVAVLGLEVKLLLLRMFINSLVT